MTSGKFATQNYGESVRRLVLEESSLEFFLDLSPARLFGRVAANPLAIGLVRGPARRGSAVRAGRLDRLPVPGEDWGRLVAIESFGSGPWHLGTGSSDPDVPGGPTIGDLVSRIGYDYISGCQEAFAFPLTRATVRRFGIESARLVPNLRPENLVGPSFLWTGRRPATDTYLLHAHDRNGVPLANLPPGAAAYLQPFRETLEARRDWNRRSYRESGRAWYELHQVAWRAGRPRLLLLRNARVATCVADPEGRHIGCDRFHAYEFPGGWTEDARLLLAFLNSAVFDRALKARATRLHGADGGLYEFEKKFVARLAFPRPGAEVRTRWLSAADRLAALPGRLAAIDPYDLPWDGGLPAVAVDAWVCAWRALEREIEVVQCQIDDAVAAACGLETVPALDRTGQLGQADRVLGRGLADWLADAVESRLAGPRGPVRVDPRWVPPAAADAIERILGEDRLDFTVRRLRDEPGRFRVEGRGKDRVVSVVSTAVQS